MNMDIRKIIPNKDQNWVVQKDILYYKKWCLIPVANYIDGDLFISLDQRCLTQIIKLLIFLEKEEIDFLFCDRNQIYEKLIYEEKIEDSFVSTLRCLEDSKFFECVQNGKIDYLGKIIKFIQKFNCHNTFRREFHTLNKRHFNRMYYDPYLNKQIHTVKNKEIRDYFDSLDREVNILLILS